MKSDRRTQATEIVVELEDECVDLASSVTELMPIVYQELRRLAAGYLRRERPGHTLQPTALVHEAYLRLVEQTHVGWRGRTHFFSVGAQMMRRVLIDHARRRMRLKRGGDWVKVTLGDAADPFAGGALDPSDLIALDDALQELARVDPREARVVELRYFAGLTVEEVAAALGVSTRTVKAEWAHAKTWLRQKLDTSGERDQA